MGTVYTSGPHILGAEGGVEANIAIRVPHRGVIKSIKFEQITGAAVACDFEVFTSRLAAPPPGEISSGSSESLDEATMASRAAYSIFGEKSMVPGTPFAEYEKDYAFRNKDGTSTNPQRFLYVAVRPAGTGPKQFALTLEMGVGVFL